MVAKGLAYTHLPSGIHQLIFHDVQASTLTDFGSHLKTIIDQTSSTDTLRLILEVSAVPSVQSLMYHIRDIKAAHPQRIPARIAVIYSQSIQLSLLSIVTRALVRTSSLRLFPRQDEQQAIEWLLK